MVATDSGALIGCKKENKEEKNMNSLFITMTDVLSNQIFLAYIFEFEDVPSSLSFR